MGHNGKTGRSVFQQSLQNYQPHPQLWMPQAAALWSPRQTGGSGQAGGGGGSKRKDELRAPTSSAAADDAKEEEEEEAAAIDAREIMKLGGPLPAQRQAFPH